MKYQDVRIKDPGLRVEVNGQEVLAENPGQSEGVMRFVLPAGTMLGDLHIHSGKSSNEQPDAGR
ncbi:hypothetical protein [Bordetella tumbae]|uniref:hypothetical protein n=1 Tax=Bordetella tumbae TaxID=1649139 RepID=UPI0039EF0055